MKKYIVKIKPIDRKKLQKMDPLLRVKFAEYIDSLENFEKAIKILDIKKLKWHKNRYRLRIWKNRVLFEKYDNKLIILVIDIWSRWDVYK